MKKIEIENSKLSIFKSEEASTNHFSLFPIDDSNSMILNNSPNKWGNYRNNRDKGFILQFFDFQK